MSDTFSQFLKSLTQYSTVYISGHLNPDADSIASTCAMYEIVSKFHNNVHPIYGGFAIEKLNLKMMIDKFELPIKNVGKEFSIKEDELLILVDCQVNQSNSPPFEVSNVAVMDHHNYAENYADQKYVFTAISPELGSCSTLIYSLAETVLEQFEFSQGVLSAMMMGLYVDTNNLTNGVDELDLKFNKAINNENRLTQVSNILRVAYSEDDTDILSQVILRRIRVDNSIVSFIGKCDNNLLGQIADFLSEVERVDYVILVSDKGPVYRFSVRSYGDIKADEIVSRYVKDIGDGGGHNNKAAGVIFKDKLSVMQFKTIESYTLEFMKMITSNSVNLTYGKDSITSFLSDKEVYLAEKKKYKVRYKKFKDILGRDFKVASFKTLEGIIEVSPEDYLVIGVKGEPYPISQNVIDTTYRELTEEEQLQLTFKKETALGDKYLSAMGMYIIFDGVTLHLSKDILMGFDLIETQPTESNNILSTKIDYPITVVGKYGVLSSIKETVLVTRADGEFYLCDKEVFKNTYEIVRKIDRGSLAEYIIEEG